ncbi:MAG TPA: hypothetical protein VF656_09430 [Pyrinomonadaceae bacterium]|jgi:hypothetical protein
MKPVNKFFAACLFLFIVPLAIAAQTPSDLEVSDARFIYDVNASVGPSGGYSNSGGGLPATTVTDSPVQQVSALFRNTGTRAIKSVAWEYVVYKDASEQEILKVYSVRSNRTILPGASVRLAKEGYHLKHSPHETARVTRIEYADGTVWQGAKTKR